MYIFSMYINIIKKNVTTKTKARFYAHKVRLIQSVNGKSSETLPRSMQKPSFIKIVRIPQFSIRHCVKLLIIQWRQLSLAINYYVVSARKNTDHPFPLLKYA